MAEQQDEPLFDGPIPGQALTAETGTRAWENPPELTTVEEATDYYLERMSSDEFTEQLVNTMETGVPITTIASILQLGAVMEGIHSLDVGMLVTPILIEMMMLIGDSEKIKYETGLERKRLTIDPSLVANITTKLKTKEIEEKETKEDIKKEPIEMDKEEIGKEEPKGLMSRRENNVE